MFRTSYRQARRRIHLAPVENREPQITTKAKEKQTLFFALSSPRKHSANSDELAQQDRFAATAEKRKRPVNAAKRDAADFRCGRCVRNGR